MLKTIPRSGEPKLFSKTVNFIQSYSKTLIGNYRQNIEWYNSFDYLGSKHFSKIKYLKMVQDTARGYRGGSPTAVQA